MKVSHLVLLGQFNTAPKLSFLRTLLSDTPVHHCQSIRELGQISLAEAAIVTDIGWLEALNSRTRNELTEQIKNSACWLAVSATATDENRLHQWLEKGLHMLLPDAFEIPLLSYLLPRSHCSEPSALILTEAGEAHTGIAAALTRWGYRVHCQPAQESLSQRLKTLSPALIIALESRGIRQLKLALHQQPQLPATLLALIDPAQPLEGHLPDAVQVHLRSDTALLQRVIRQYRSPALQDIQRRNQSYFRRIQELLEVLGEDAIVSRTNRAGKITQANARFCSISGYQAAEIVGQTHRIIKSDLHPDTFFRNMWQRLTTGKVWHGIVCNRNKQGLLYWISTRMFPIADPQGVISAYVCISSDVSALQQNRQRLQHLTELFQVEQSNNATWHCDLKSGRIYLSNRAIRLLNQDTDLPANLMALGRLMHPADRLPALQQLNQSLRTQQPFELRFRLRLNDPSLRWFSLTGYPIHDHQQRPLQLQGVVQECQGPAPALPPTGLDNALFQQLFHASEHCMAISDAQGYVLFTNPAYQRQMGVSEAGVVGRHCGELISTDPATARRLVHQLLVTEQPWQGITTRRRQDGSEFPAANMFGPIRNHAGEVTHLFTIFADISQQVMTQQNLSADRDAALQASLAKSEFLSRFGHELRTPLNSVLGFAQLLEQDERLNLFQQEQVQSILSAGRHLLDLINSILDLSRIEAGKVSLSYSRTDLEAVIRECFTLLQHLTEEKQISIDLNLMADNFLQTDRLRLKQILLNLISNALLYTPSQGRIEIITRQLSGHTLRIEVNDNGPGISSDQLDSIFQPYQRLQENSQLPGSGIGLAVCHQLTALMQGEIGVVSVPGEGSSFWLELPQCHRQSGDSAPACADAVAIL